MEVLEGLSRETARSGKSGDLFELAAFFLQRKRFVARVAMVGFIVSLCAYFVIPKKFSATARILPPKQEQGMMSLMMAQMGGVATLAGDILGKGTVSDLYVGLLNTEAIKDIVIDKFKLMQVYRESSRIDTYEKLDKRVDISAGKKDGIISISVEDKDPKRAVAMANTFVEEVGKLSVRLNIASASENKGYLEQRLAKAKESLAKAEDDLKRFQASTKTFDISEQAKGTIKGIADLYAQLAMEEVKLASLQRVLTDSSVEVKNQKMLISSIKSQIARYENSSKEGSVIPTVGSVPNLGQESVRLMREFKIQETIFELLTKQYEIAKMDESKNVNNVQVVQYATIPDKHVKPKASAVIVGGTFGSFVLALGIIYLQYVIAGMDHGLKERIVAVFKNNQ